MKTKRLIAWLLACAPLIITAIVLPVLPDSVPAHYGFSGEVDRYGSKYEMLILPIITFLYQIFWIFMEKIGAKDREKGEQNAKILFWCNIASTGVLLILTIWFLSLSYSGAESISGSFDFAKILAIAVSLGWITLGNILPKCKQNALVGIRTKWTLKSETVWYKTHKIGGIITTIFGVISALLCLTLLRGTTAVWVTIGGFVAVAVFLVIYSYVIYDKQVNRE
ncbi:MAG: SdpI family protein [Oscillospiraceae bacterium]|jgi:uncharacterized membrane protein|nr:SdpI family protein [Oscillospiraceae bacterium]